MKKKLLVIGIIVNLLMIGLGGCQEKNVSLTATCSANTKSGTVPLTVNFAGSVNGSGGTVESYFWDFDDGSTSTIQNPSHTFSNIGIYEVKFTVTYHGANATDIVTISVIQSLFNLTPIADAYVNGREPEINYCNSFLDVDFYELFCCDDWKKQSYLKFDLSDIPSEAIIKSAKLRLYCWFLFNETTVVRVLRSHDITWGENEITWANQPYQPVTISYVDAQTVAFINKWYEWDVTSYVKSALFTERVTFLLDTSTDLGYVSFHSKEKENSPELYIELS
jgi:hypothetical protein